MALKPLLAAALVTVAALAGCSDSPPSGALTAAASGLAVDGTSDNRYTAEVRPAGQVPGVGGDLCPPAGSPPQVPQCVDASSAFKVHFMALPQPEGTYEAVLVNASGERPLGPLVQDAANMWELNMTVNGENLEGRFDRVEVRMGEFVLATASAAAGTQEFSLAEGLDGASATGTYRGKVLTVEVSGLPGNGTYTGRLYQLDEESGLLSPVESFPIQNGPNEHRSEQDIGDFAEFHIHVGASNVNLFRATLG